jgi:hypothetical protein
MGGLCATAGECCAFGHCRAPPPAPESEGHRTVMTYAFTDSPGRWIDRVQIRDYSNAQIFHPGEFS